MNGERLPVARSSGTAPSRPRIEAGMNLQTEQSAVCAHHGVALAAEHFSAVAVIPEWLPARSIAERLLRDGDPASIFDYR